MELGLSLPHSDNEVPCHGVSGGHVGSSNKSLFPPGLTTKAKVEGVGCVWVWVCVCVCELSLPASSNKILLSFPSA